MSTLYPVISRLSLDSLGLTETLYEPHDKLFFYVLCDPVNLSNPTASLKISKLFEKCIREYINLNRNDISEKLLKKAIEHAQNYFYKNYISSQNQLKVNVVIILQLPNENPNSVDRNILIAGVGDIKVYHLDTSIQLIYYDPELPQLPEGLSYKKRFNYITNALGAPDIKCRITTSTLNHKSSLLVATYGSYSHTNKEKLFSVFADFENKKPQIHRLIQKSKEKDHLKSYSYISFFKPNLSKNLIVPNSTIREITGDCEIEKKKDRYLPLWAIKIGLVAIVCLLCLEFFNYYLNSSKPPLYSLQKKVTPKQVQTNITLRSLKKPLEFPFLKERAYIVDLKEKYERQSEVVEKLQEIISEQDKALRNLQVRNYYQPDTISAKPFRSKKKISDENFELDNYDLED